MQKESTIEIKPLTNTHNPCYGAVKHRAVEIFDFVGLAEMALRCDKHLSDKETTLVYLKKNVLFAYEIYENKEFYGYSFAMKFFSYYTLDGYKEGGTIWCAVFGGRVVIGRLFKEYTDKILTFHDIELRAVGALVKRLGFVRVGQYCGQNVFVLRRSL